MIYKYDERVVNQNNDFLSKDKFVGYILPDGSIYQCKDHNITNVYTFLKMYLKLLDIDYENKDEFLNVNTKDNLANVILYKLKRMSHDEIHALLKFIDNNIILSDILVCFFGCHQITRLRKNVITSEVNHLQFYNYLLHDFTIKSIPRIVYDEKSKKCQYINVDSQNEYIIDRNEYLYDDVDNIRNEVDEEYIDLFIK